MTETTKNSGEKLSVTPTKTLTLKRGSVEQGVVRQSFSHGRSKAVVVEKVKRRIAGPGEVKTEAPAADRGAAPKRAGAPVKPATGARSRRRGGAAHGKTRGPRSPCRGTEARAQRRRETARSTDGGHGLFGR